MTSPVAATPVTTSIPADALRIVLFGMPDAGKTSLLGALSLTAQTHERALHGRLTDVRATLAELQRQVYDDKPRETLEEIVPHVVTFDPTRGGIADVGGRVQAVIFDCDGRVANEILTNPQSLADRKAGKLARAILDADALVLVIDAASTSEQIDADFREFVRFLHLLERYRGKRADVAGLPVFLVLSKCDLLVQPGDPPALWSERIAARKDQVHERFLDFIHREAGAGFGSLSLEVRTTAVRRPALGTLPAQPREPFGVGELFRECFRAAQDFRGRAERSHARVLMAVLGGIAAVLMMAATAVMLYLSRTSIQPLPLASSVESYRTAEGQTPSARLTEPLQRKIGVLSDFQNSPEFGRLPPELQDYVRSRLKELVAYREYRDQLALVRPPSDLRTHDELNQFERRLNDDLAIPADYRNDWSQTDAALLRDKWLDDVRALRESARTLERWQQDLADEAQLLLLFEDKQGRKVAIPWAVWHERCRKLLTDADTPPFRAGEKLRNSRSLPAQRAPALTYAPVFAFPTVEDARRNWERSRQRLERLRDITQALGLAGEISVRYAPLRVADPGIQRSDQLRERLAALKKQYPAHSDWTPTDIPDVARPEVHSIAQSAYDHWLATGRSLVLQEFLRLRGDSPEKHEHWLQIAEWAGTSAELRDWRDLAVVLQKLSGSRAVEPVQDLVRFLRERSFAIEIRKVVVVIPDSLRESRLRPIANFQVHVQAGDKTESLAFKQIGAVGRDERRGVSTYTFEADGRSSLSFTPDQECWAEILLKDDAREWRMYWFNYRTHTYSFERLSTEPMLFPKDELEKRKGVPATKVSTTYEPATGIPRLPDLLPDVPKGGG